MRAATVLRTTLVLATLAFARPANAQDLKIYFVDTEGGQATLYVAPTGESLLVDTGNAGPRDHERLMATIRAAGVQRIDHLLITHYHGDHHGGLELLSQAIPIRNYYDHGPSSEAGRANVDAFMTRYVAITGSNRHIVKPGDKIPLAPGIDVTVVTSNKALLETPMARAPGAGQPNPFCASQAPKDLSAFTDIDNDYSAGIVLTHGAFRTINLGDFTWNLEHDLVCPNNPIGTIDLYLTSHHGLDRSGGPAMVHALQPRVAIMNNGTRKGGSPDALQTLRLSPGIEDIWQLHYTYAGGVEYNTPGVFIANLDAPAVLANVINPPPPGQGGQGQGGPGGQGPGGPGPGGPGGQGPGGPGGGAPGGAPGGGAPGGGPGGGGGAPSGGGPGGGGGFGGGGGGAAATPAAHTPAYGIVVTAQPNGTFTVTNERNGFTKTYRSRG